jgi:hypothetical protein
MGHSLPGVRDSKDDWLSRMVSWVKTRLSRELIAFMWAVRDFRGGLALRFNSFWLETGSGLSWSIVVVVPLGTSEDPSSSIHPLYIMQIIAQ